MKGTVKRVFLPRGFAFVIGDDGKDYFFQAGELRDATWGGSVIKEQTRVEFEPIEVATGLRATEVRLC